MRNRICVCCGEAIPQSSRQEEAESTLCPGCKQLAEELEERAKNDRFNEASRRDQPAASVLPEPTGRD